MLKWITLCIAVVFVFRSNLLLAQEEKEYYQYAVNLSETINDMITVDLIVPIAANQENNVIFHMPATIPGTYEIYNFGQFVQDLRAFDKKNKPLKVVRKDENTWQIEGDKKLYKITYKVEDTWDAALKTPQFEPSGSNFEQGKVFVINNNACFGFIKGKENLPFEVKFKRPSAFYGSTALDRVGGDFDTDIYKAPNYKEFVDAPLMYCQADTVQFRLGMSEILISVYSPNQKVTAKQLSQYIKPTLEAQFKYLDEVLPVRKYSFIIYLSPDGYPSGSIGALEHARSSLFCMMEETAEKIGKQIAEIAAHEFFHIITPLHIHSEQIHNFDFMAPKMSKHLWFYEGAIEYMGHHVRAKYEIVNQSQFLKNLSDKARTALTYYKDDIPFTEMSEKCLEPPYSKQYNNVYYKGALIGMCLDLKIIELTEGKYSLRDLIRALALEYGSDKSFEDAKLFDIITNLLQKEFKIANVQSIKDFFNNHVAGNKPIPYNEYVAPFGLIFSDQAKVLEISPLGGLEKGALKTDSLDRFYVSRPDRLDEFGKKLGLQDKDIILTWNDKPFTPRNVSAILFTYLDAAKEGDLLNVKIMRKNAEGKEEEMMLSERLSKIEVEQKFVFTFNPNANEKQIKMRNIWLTNKAQ